MGWESLWVLTSLALLLNEQALSLLLNEQILFLSKRKNGLAKKLDCFLFGLRFTTKFVSEFNDFRLRSINFNPRLIQRFFQRGGDHWLQWEEDKEAQGEETVFADGERGLWFRSAGEAWGFSVGGLWYGFDQSGVPNVLGCVFVGGLRTGHKQWSVVDGHI